MKKNRLLLALALVAALVLSLGLVGCGAKGSTPEPTTPAEEPAVSANRADILVTVEELAANADQYFIIDARGAEAYEAGHVPGAINLPWQPLASVGVGAAGDDNWGTLLSADEIGAVLGGAGVDTNKTIVVYSDPTGWGEDGRIMWTLASVGITNVRMLDGGYPKWAASQEVSTDAVTAPATTVSVSPELDASFNVTTDYIQQNLDSLLIIDVRSAKEYEGATDFGEKRGGHLPGAINIEFASFFNEDGTVKEAADIEKMLTDAGASKDKEVVFYCTKGIRSGFATMVSRWLGFENARNYDASYYTWAGNADLPLE